MPAIDVTGLPEPVVQALQGMVDSLKEQFSGKNGESAKPYEYRPLKSRPGAVIGPITRESLYGDDR